MEIEDLSVLLVGNYAPDTQQSMLRFANCLERELPRHGLRATVLSPAARVGRKARTRVSGFGKWLGYADKLALFPPLLRGEIRAQRRPFVVHVCDHSNALYLTMLPGVPAIVTCHDMLAARGALGEETDCPASLTGRYQQRWIVAGLRRARAVACVSGATLQDYRRVVSPPESQRVVTIHNGLNAPFRQLDRETLRGRLASVPALAAGQRFLLHVGSSLRRKNRELIIRVLKRLEGRWQGQAVFAGDPLTRCEMNLANTLGVRSRIVEVAAPAFEVLEALYNAAFALVFPSRHEGFGWPVIEAQACGCPVICSDQTSLPEVAGAGAFIRGIEGEDPFAEAVLELESDPVRQFLIDRGHENVAKFTTERMVKDYIALYRAVAGNL